MNTLRFIDFQSHEHGVDFIIIRIIRRALIRRANQLPSINPASFRSGTKVPVLLFEAFPDNERDLYFFNLHLHFPKQQAMYQSLPDLSSGRAAVQFGKQSRRTSRTRSSTPAATRCQA
ncbi:hypothetical protein G5555_13970, partial [Pseudomonas aeruginosa]|nr:hypothetical protein [Pseudomonas aeruginosa]